MDPSDICCQSLFENTSIAVSISRNEVVLYANKAYVTLFGFDRPDEIVGKPVADRWSSEYLALIRERELLGSRGLPTPPEYEALALRRDGLSFPAHVNATSLDLPDGQVTVEFIVDLTQRKQAEELALRRYQYIDTILEEAPIGFAVHTIDDGVGRFISARFEEIYGVPRGTIDSHYSFFDKVWPHNADFRENIRSRVQADMNSGDASRMHWEHVPVWNAKGEIRYINAMNIPLPDQNLMVSTVQDVTEQVRTLDALRESEAQFRGVFEGSIEGIYWSSPDGKILALNPAMANLLGYDTVEEAIRSITDVGQQLWTGPQERDRYIRRLDEQGAIRGYEVQFRRRDATRIWVLLNSRSVFGPEGRITHYETFVSDISDRKRAEQALEKSRSLLLEVESIGKVGGWEINLDTKKLTWTQEVYAIHEVDSTYEPTVEKAIQFYTPASRGVIDQLVRRAVELGESYDAELEIVTAKGNLRSVHAIGKASLKDRRVYGFFQDITASKLNEREMSQLRLELAHLNRILTLSEISGALAHEINQPLGAIQNNAEAARVLLTQSQDKWEEMPEIVEEIIQAAARAGDVIRKLRTLEKKDNTAFEPLSINSLIEEVLAILHSTFTINNVALQLDLQPNLPSIFGDRVRLQQVLLNLLTNAIEAIKEASSRIISIRSAIRDPNMVAVSVSDSGPGIAEAKRELLYQPFFTTKRNGLRLGLSICKSIVEEHGGRIWEDNNPSGGATFSFSLKTSLK